MESGEKLFHGVKRFLFLEVYEDIKHALPDLLGVIVRVVWEFWKEKVCVILPWGFHEMSRSYLVMFRVFVCH